MHISESDLKNLLFDTGLIDEKRYESAKKEATRAEQTFLNVLIGSGDISEEYLAETLSSFFKVSKIDLRKIEIKTEVLEMIPEAMAKKKNIAIFDFDKDKKIIKLAMEDPGDLAVQEFLKAKFDCSIDVYLTSGPSLRYALRQYKRKIGEEFTKIIEENIKKATVAGVVSLEKMAAEVPIINILDTIIEHAVTLGASDIHFEPLSEVYLVRYRIEGIMREILTLPKSVHPFLVARVKVLANLLIDEHRIAQDGRFKFDMDEGTVDVRVSVMPTFNGEKVEMRILKGSSKPLNLEELGLNPQNLQILQDNIKKTHGMILVTGPTGSGKTTTLYAVLHILNSSEVNIVTIEDPIEYAITRISQIQVNPKAGITFASGLRAILRQDPDIMMIGEIRDKETAEIAIHSALTGHSVLSTLHTNDAPSAIPRLLDMGVEPFLLSSTLNLVIAQRLVRKVCSFCIESHDTSTEIERLISAQAALTGLEKPKIPARIFIGKGCKLCNYSGYKGQVAIFECFNVSEKIKELITERASADVLTKQALKDGMVTMFQDGLDKIEAGVTTIEEVLRVVRE